MLIMSTIMREMAPSMKYLLYFFMKTLYIKFSLRIDEKNIVVTYSLCLIKCIKKEFSLYHYSLIYSINNQEWYRRLYNCFYFSVIIFTTVGLGDIKPKGGFKAWAIIEGILGWLTMILFLVILANVWMR